MRPRCYNRPPFVDTLLVPNGWNLAGGRVIEAIPDSMSKGCQQHGPMGEATLHPEQWACGGCVWKPETNQTETDHA
jgi:hypothetical protein